MHGLLFCPHTRVYLLPGPISSRRGSLAGLILGRAERLAGDMTEPSARSAGCSEAEGERRRRRRKTILWVVLRRERADIHGGPGR
mgnify:CR=1 FL=1